MNLTPNEAVTELRRLVLSDQSEIRINANGGNSILMVCAPEEELDFIESLEELSDDKFIIVDLNQVLIDFVENNKELIDLKFDILSGSIEQIFRNNEEDVDLFDMILNKISAIYEQGKVPVIIGVGLTYATQFELLALMENSIIMTAALPTVFLYPAKYDDKNHLRFLNKRIASQYRCEIL